MNILKNKRRTSAKRLLGLCLALLMFVLATLGTSAADSSEVDVLKGASFKYADVKLCPGGMAFGVKLATEGVLVVSLAKLKTDSGGVSPAEQAGIMAGDVISSANGVDVDRVDSLSEIIRASKGNEISLTLLRKGEQITVGLTPVISDGIYRGGMWLRDSAAGIGTVTYFNPNEKCFGGLGHGICDSDTGVVMPLKRGVALEANIGGVVKGKSGAPGELKGYFRPEKIGAVLKNTSCGVFGAYTSLPCSECNPLPVASRDEISEGKAELLCTLGEDGVKSYEISISKISRQSHDNKSFVITVTDKKLKDRTGGIVQGMSGSPIIQNGKIIGAVTHV